MPTLPRRLLPTLLALCCGCARAPPPPPPPEVPVESGAPLRNGAAEDLYKAERFAEAAWIFKQIAEHERPHNLDHDRPRAEFWLAKSYYKLHDQPRATALLLHIAGQPEHPYYTLAFPWLLQLYLDALPPDAKLLAALLAYPEDQIRGERAYDEIIDDYDMVLAETALRRGDARGAYQTLRALERDQGERPDARLLLTLGRAAERLGEPATARGYYERCNERLAELIKLQRRLGYAPGSDRSYAIWLEANRGLRRVGGKPDKRALK